MKRLLFLSIIILLPIITFAQGINAIYSFTTYNIPNKSPYVEVNTSIEANSISYVKNSEGKDAGLVELLLIIKKDSSIVYVEKREIKAIKAKDNSSIVDIQRISLENGKYVARFEISDKNKTSQPLTIEDNFEVNYPKNQIAVSDVQIIDNYKKTTEQNIRSKNGLDLTPYLFDALPEIKNQVTYYAEIYNADKQFGYDSNYVVSVIIENIRSGKKFEGTQKLKREQAKDVTVVIGNLDIEKLPQGSYFLVVEARDGKNILFAYNKIAFYRYSKLNAIERSSIPADAFVNNVSEKDINEYLYCLLPIASESQKGYIKRSTDTASIEDKKFFLYAFWKGINPENPNGEWRNYMNEVEYVNTKYSTKIRKGYETDMGRVYLVYGKPDVLIDEKFKSTSGMRKRTTADKSANREASDESAGAVSYMPYQIWRYKRTPFGEANKGFVFYAPQNNLMEYFLLHSDAKGEPFDYYWENRLTRGSLEEGIEGDAGVQFRRGY